MVEIIHKCFTEQTKGEQSKVGKLVDEDSIVWKKLSFLICHSVKLVVLEIKIAVQNDKFSLESFAQNI